MGSFPVSLVLEKLLQVPAKSERCEWVLRHSRCDRGGLVEDRMENSHKTGKQKGECWVIVEKEYNRPLGAALSLPSSYSYTLSTGLWLIS